MVSVREVQAKEEQVLSNLLQKYLYEMSPYFHDEIDADGNYPYRYLPLYFTEADRRAYFIYDDDQIIGFALINAYSLTDEPMDNCIAEFTIFPVYRSKGKGLDAVDALVKLRSGKWQLKYVTMNQPAERFWNKVKQRYNGRMFPMSRYGRIVEFEADSDQ